MIVSSFSTVCYLHRHMKSMAQSSSKFTSPRIQSQRRVTITGILQGVLYLLYDSFYLIDSFTWMFSSHFYFSAWIFITATSLYISGTTVNLGIAFLVPWMIVQYYAHNSMTCYAWLNFYYYIQIVPAQRSLWIWMKKNIRSVIYVALAVDTILLLFNGTVDIVEALLLSPFDLYLTFNNDTWSGHFNDELHVTSLVSFFILRLYIIFCLCVMIVSSFSTVCYLHRHMKSMAQSSSKFTSPRIQSQRRVTITGILQGVFYLVYDSFYLIDSFTWLFSSHFYFSAWITFTATSLYISGTTVNLGIGQAIFRQRAVDVWKAIKALFGVGMVTNDVKLHSSQLTSGETTNPVTTVEVSL
uniref:Taste receptor type 2 n=1 Tax=Amphiprion ocellaris TaxID=80972 RepID=A0AAQ5X4V6_AMPOC